MIIPSQLPQIVTAARSGALQALGLQAGQVLDGKVVGPAPNGGTQVQISGQLLNLLLPQATKAGDLLRFEVQSAGAQIRLALQVDSARPQVASAPVSTQAQTTATTPSIASSPTTPATTVAQPQTSAASAAAPPAGTSSAPAATPQPAPASTPSSPGAASPTVAQASALPGATPLPATASPRVALTDQSTPARPQSPSAPSNPTPSSQAQANPPAAVTTAPPAASSPTGQLAGQAVPRQSTPYAQSVPSSATSSAPSTVAAASAAGAAQTSGAVAQTVVPPSITTVTAALPSTPQAALADMVQRALPVQNSIVSLTTALTSIAGQVALPEAVVRAAEQVLANRVVIQGGKLDGNTLQKAVLNSGVFQEAALARSGTPLLAPQADMKTALLALRQTLTNWLGQQPALLASAAQVAPPLRGRIPRVRSLDIPPIDPALGAEEVGKHLLDRTESALSRTRLHQHASLPDPKVKGADWSADLPIVIGGHQTLLQLQIHRDEHNGTQESGERGWQMRFAINLPDRGEVGAQVSLRGSATGVMLWAAERSTSEALEADLDGLRGALAAAGLSTGAVIVRHGAPPDSQLPSNAGHFVDARR